MKYLLRNVWGAMTALGAFPAKAFPIDSGDKLRF